MISRIYCLPLLRPVVISLFSSQKKIFMGTTGKLTTHRVNVSSRCIFYGNDADLLQMQTDQFIYFFRLIDLALNSCDRNENQGL
jgi:hypothetical protein